MRKKPLITFPIHDKDGRLTGLLLKNKAVVAGIFDRAVVAVTTTTQETCPRLVKTLEADDFWVVVRQKEQRFVADDFLAGYEKSLTIADNEQKIHLAVIDRLVMAIGIFRKVFYQRR